LGLRAAAKFYKAVEFRSLQFVQTMNFTGISVALLTRKNFGLTWQQAVIVSAVELGTLTKT
jgi:hypothetical protein